jgi:hypothetical protein
MNTNEIKDPQLENLQDAFAAHRQMLRETMERSAESMRQALALQQTMYGELSQGVVAQVEPNPNPQPDAALGSLTAEFVGTAYRRAREMFEELERSVAESQAKALAPVTTQPVPDRPVDQTAENALAGSALMMSQATAHLNQAMEAVVQAMNNRLNQPVNVPGINNEPNLSKTQRL